MPNPIRTNDEARAAAIRMAIASKRANYRLTLRAYAHTKRGQCPATLVKFCTARGISLAGVERAYRVAYDEA